MDIIYNALGIVLKFIYDFCGNFGVAIIIFTVLIRLALIPLTVKQQKSMAHMQKIQPLLNDINKKYQNDKTKLNEETMKLYKEHNVNPMGGCLPLLIQMPILIAIYGVIQNPITYILKIAVPEEILTALCNGNNTLTQLGLVAFISNNGEAAKGLLDSAGLVFDRLNELVLNFNFLWINLGLIPKENPTNYLLLIMPLIGALTTYLSSKLTSKQQSQNNSNNQAASQMQAMQMIFPFMTGYFCYILPAAMGLYWIIGNLIQILQSYTLDRYILKKTTSEPLVIEPKQQKKKKK